MQSTQGAMMQNQTGSFEFTGRLYPHGGPARVLVRDGTIAEVGSIASFDEPSGTERWIMPGLFDLQVNGFAGRNFIDADVTIDDARHIAEAVLATGVTGFLPTVITAGMDTLCHQLAVIAEAIERDPLVRRMCPGAHLEGPFIHPDDGPRGAHPSEHVRPPSIPDFERLFDAARGRLAVITVAADQPGSADLIRHAVSRGVTVAVGHHRPGPADIDAAVAAGARFCTHLGNGSDAMLPRHNNYIWQQLAEDRLRATFISDGHHLPAWTVRVMLRAKTTARSLLITDAMGAAGMPAGRYKLGDAEVERTPDGKVVLPGTPYLAGSAADMPLVVSTAVRDGGIPLQDAIAMAALQPRELLGLRQDGEPWTCPVGQAAGLAEVSWDVTSARLRVLASAAGPFYARVS